MSSIGIVLYVSNCTLCDEQLLIEKAEWGQVLFGRVLVSAVDEKGRHQTTELGFGDIWYFPKGQAHTVQGLDDENEYLLAFDDADFDRAG